MELKKNKYTKLALALSVAILVLWCVLGTGTSLAWFTDDTETAKNMFQIGELNLVVSHRTDDGYEEIDETTAVFSDEDLYEPGHTQVVYLKFENRGKIPFDYKTAVNILEYTTAKNVLGFDFNLYDYLKFGFITADTEAEIDDMVANRELAKEHSNEEMPINTYSTNVDSLNVGEVAYGAIIVRMPEEVGNAANYRGDIVPMVKLGLVVKAQQQGTPIE